MNILEKIIYSIVSPSKFFAYAEKHDRIRDCAFYYFLLSWIPSIIIMLLYGIDQDNIIMKGPLSFENFILLGLSSLLLAFASSTTFFLYTFIVYLVTQLINKKYEYRQSAITVSYGLTPLLLGLALALVSSYMEYYLLMFLFVIIGFAWSIALFIKGSKIIYKFTTKQSILTMLVAPIFGVIAFSGLIVFISGLSSKNTDLINLSYIMMVSGVADYITIVFLVKSKKTNMFKSKS